MRTHPNRTRHSLAAFSIACVFALAACSHSSGPADAPAASAPPAHREVLVTMGSNATFGDSLDNPLIDSWPQRLYHEAFPRSAEFVNAADREVTIDRVLSQQVPLAIQLHAAVVAIWVGDTDLADGRTAASFETLLDTAVTRLRASGARVLVGNLERSLSGAPAYDDAIARVASAHGATVVDIATDLAAFHDVRPSAPVNRTASIEIARAFATALARS